MKDQETCWVSAVILLSEISCLLKGGGGTGTARSFRKLAKVVKLFRGKNGVVRAAEIRVLSKDAKTSIVLRRPLELLIPTEISSNEREDHVEEDTVISPHAVPFEPKITFITRSRSVLN